MKLTLQKVIGGIALISQAIATLEQAGYRVRAVPIEHMDELRVDLERHYREGRISEEIHRMLGRCFRFESPADLPDARSVFIIAAASPRVMFHVHWQGRRVPIHLPSTYSEIGSMAGQKLEALREALKPFGYTAVGARLPEKSIAVRSGLASYGRNNITYIPGLGSLHRLDAFCSNAPCESDSWGEPRLMERCETCKACRDACPTGAIHGDWMVIRAERCLCHLNEGGDEFPSWVDPSWHDSIVGCFHCQRVCPENAAVLDKISEGPDFSEDEVSAILSAKRADDVSPDLYEKLKPLGLHVYMHAIARNMRVLLERVTV